MKLTIKYFGKDYSKIDDCLKEMPPILCGFTDDHEKYFNQSDILKKILIDFLERSNRSRFGEDEYKANEEIDDYVLELEKKVYNSNNLSFQGKVGIIEGYVNHQIDENNNVKIRVHLQINTRFDVDYKYPYFLTTLLLNDSIKFVDSNIPSDSNDDIFNYMYVLLFKKYLLDASKKGLYKTYVRFEENNNRPKGTMNIARHIKENIGQNNGKIAYSYRENTTNNYLNKLILYTYKYLSKNFYEIIESCFNEDCHDIINTILSSVDIVEYPASFLISKNQNSIHHPYYFEYDLLRKICLKIIRNEEYNLYDANEEEEVNGFLSYVPNLWENFLNSYFYESKFNYHSQYVKYIIQSNGDFIQEARPDFVFDKDDNTHDTILDAKFVRGWEKIYDGKTLSGSRMADYNKCIRDMNMLAIHKAGVVFPVEESINSANNIYDNEKIVHRISDLNNSDMFYTFGILIPKNNQNENYIAYRTRLDKNVKKTMNKIKEIINN